MFNVFKKKFKNPFDFTEKIQSPVDIYAKLVCNCAERFLEVTELNKKNIKNCEIAMGFTILIMAHNTDMKYEHIKAVIKRLQENMYKNNFSYDEINEFYQKSDFYYNKILESLQDFVYDRYTPFAMNNYIKLIFSLNHIEPEEHLYYFIKASESINIIPVFLETHEKISSNWFDFFPNTAE